MMAILGCLRTLLHDSDEDDDKNNGADANSIQIFIYLRAELNSQWPITESARIQTTAIRQHRTKQTNKNKTKKNGSPKAF
jgi:hypothetical protein